MTPKREVARLIDNSKSRPADILIPWSSNRWAAVDVTITCPLQPNFIRKTADTGGVAAEAAECAKVKKHEQACETNGLAFIPFALETTGGYGKQAENMTKLMIRRLCERSFEAPCIISQRVWQVLSLVVQRGNASAIKKRMVPLEVNDIIAAQPEKVKDRYLKI
jgi:hypothetical protein